MGKLTEAQLLTIALEEITIQELVDLSEDDTIRLAMAFEDFVDKIGEVVRKVNQESRRKLN